MMVLQDPPGFVVRTEAQKAASDNGYRLELGIKNGWLRYGSTTGESVPEPALSACSAIRRVL
jgi:hypothetical protein